MEEKIQTEQGGHVRVKGGRYRPGQRVSAIGLHISPSFSRSHVTACNRNMRFCRIIPIGIISASFFLLNLNKSIGAQEHYINVTNIPPGHNNRISTCRDAEPASQAEILSHAQAMPMNEDGCTPSKITLPANTRNKKMPAL